MILEHNETFFPPFTPKRASALNLRRPTDADGDEALAVSYVNHYKRDCSTPFNVGLA